MNARRWVFAEVDPREAESLAAALSISPPAARVLCARGIRDLSAARKFLRPSLEHLHDPFLLTGMQEAVARLRRAIERGEKILIYGDYDTDGVTSVVILKKAIELAGGKADYHVPHRLRDGYGMRCEVIEAAAQRGVSLIVSVDTGIRAAEVVRRAAELSIDVIITDHHLPEPELPSAVAVLNPNRGDCPYPEKNLCGAGVVFKLVQALMTRIDCPPERRRALTESFLKMAAIATVADVVPLTGENRILVKYGLEALRSVNNPGLRALLSEAGFPPGTVPSAEQIAFRIAPRVNAAGRMAVAEEAIEMFLTADPERARAFAEQLSFHNAGRQQAEAEVVDAILDECSQAPVTNAQAALVFARQGWHRGVVGIAAGRLAERYHRPAFVLSLEDGIAHGSGRGIPQFHILEALETMRHLFLRFGGHKQAAGISIEASRIDEFRTRLNEYALERLGPQDLITRIDIDCCLDLPEIQERAIAELVSFAPFGTGNLAPLFAVLGAEVAAPPEIFAEKHLRVRLAQKGRTMPVKAWNFAERIGELTPGARIDAAICFEEDGSYYGRPTWTLAVRDIRPAP